MKKFTMMALLSGMVLGYVQNNFATLTNDGNTLNDYSKDIEEMEKLSKLKLRDALLKNDIELVKQLLNDRLPDYFEIIEGRNDKLEEKIIDNIYIVIATQSDSLAYFIKNIDMPESQAFDELCVDIIITRLINRYANYPWFMNNLKKFTIFARALIHKKTLDSYNECMINNEFKKASIQNDITLLKQMLINNSCIDSFKAAVKIVDIDEWIKLFGEARMISHINYDIKRYYEGMRRFVEQAPEKTSIFDNLYADLIITRLINQYGNSPWFISNLKEFVTHTKNVVAQATTLGQDPLND